MQTFLLQAITTLAATQAPQAAIVGAVRDGETSGPIAGAVVALPDLSRLTTADADGNYRLLNVPPGPQHITVRFIGYTPRTLHALVPPAGRLDVNVTLRREPVRLRTIEVRPRVPIRDMDGDRETTFPDRKSSIAAALHHPLLTEPDVFQALGGGEIALRPESPSGVHIRGGASDQTAYLLDGMPVFSPYHVAGLFSAWNPDALSELQVAAAAPSPASPHALSGVVAAVTRSPDPQVRAQGGVSTTQARLTLDGPLGLAGATYLVSGRSGFPSLFAPAGDASYVRGATHDWLMKFETRLLGGGARALAYGSRNEIDATVVAEGSDAPAPSFDRNRFEWYSRSLGAEWTRRFGRSAVQVMGWSATGDAASVWAADIAPVALTSVRRDAGLLATVTRSSAHATTMAGIRVEQSQTSYRVASAIAATPFAAFHGRTPVSTLLAQHMTRIGPRMALELGAALATTSGRWYPAPRTQLRWTPSVALTFSGSYARLYQFTQSLRNAESVVSTVFPADLYIGAGVAGVPVARSSQGVLAAEYRPTAGVRIGIQGYERRSDGLVLVAPAAGEPFMTAGFTTGSATARGAAAEAAMSTARYGLVASYGVQRVRLAYAGGGYTPEYSATHRVEGGIIFFPSATSSVRIGATGIAGRRTTLAVGGFEWEACNLLDRGCEFGGSPHHGGEPLGATALPFYARLDLGVRKHWHIRVGRRDASVAVFGSVTNVLGRENVLTYVRDPSTSGPVPIEMRPRAPLVVGLDWQF